MRASSHSRGFTVVELAAMLAAAVLLIVLVAPVLAGTRGSSRIDVSISNLRTISAAHQVYAGEWDGRQYTAVVDDLAAYSSLSAYTSLVGEHPPLLLGWGKGVSGAVGLYAYWHTSSFNISMLWPISPNSRLGWFRIPNGKALHDYLGGKFYDPVYYAPNDAAPMYAATPYFDAPYEFLSQSPDEPFWSSYCLSPAAMFAPHVLDRINPTLATTFGPMPDDALHCPGFAAALYPSLKTHMIEHNWCQNPPATCNPNFPHGPYFGCDPYYFNHGVDSSPVALFYDGSVRQLPNREALAADAQVAGELGSIEGLWFHIGGAMQAGSLGSDGYWVSAGYDKTEIGHHILTIDGIRGRDTLGK